MGRLTDEPVPSFMSLPFAILQGQEHFPLSIQESPFFRRWSNQAALIVTWLYGTRTPSLTAAGPLASLEAFSAATCDLSWLRAASSIAGLVFDERCSRGLRCKKYATLCVCAAWVRQALQTIRA
jgi:hypothetical protein